MKIDLDKLKELCDIHKVKLIMDKNGKVNITPTVKSLAAASLGAVLVGAFVTAANLSGTAATIAALFTFILVGAAAMSAMDAF